MATLIKQGKVWLRGPAGSVPAPIGRSTGFIGWRDHDVVHLLPDAAIRAVTAFLRESGESSRISPSRLLDDLVKEGIALRQEAAQAQSLRTHAARGRVVVLRASALSLDEATQRPDADRLTTFSRDDAARIAASTDGSGGTLG